MFCKEISFPEKVNKLKYLKVDKIKEGSKYVNNLNIDVNYNEEGIKWNNR